MMKQRLSGLLAMALVFGFVACNSGSDKSSADADTANDLNTETTTATSTGSYAARADSFRINSENGVYLDARTGKKIKIKVDPETGVRTNVVTGEPVTYYVDTRTWNVYGKDSWEPIGVAKKEGNVLVYKDDHDKWVAFDKRWKIEGDGDMKMKTEDVKIKVDKDGEMKIKTDDGKTKITEDGVKEKKD